MMLCTAPSYTDEVEVVAHEAKVHSLRGPHKIPQWLTELLTDVHFQTQEEFAKLDKRVQDQGMELQRLAQRLGRLDTTVGKHEAVASSLAESVVALEGKLNGLSAVLRDRESALRSSLQSLRDQRPPEGLLEELLETKCDVQPEAKAAKAPRSSNRRTTTLGAVELTNSKESIAADLGQSVKVRDLEVLRVEVEEMVHEKVHKVQQKMDKDVAGLMDIMDGNNAIAKETQHFTDSQFDLLQTQYHLYGVWSCLFSLNTTQLPAERREKVKEMLHERQKELEQALQPCLMNPIMDPLKDIMEKIEHRSSARHKSLFGVKVHTSESARSPEVADHR
eukprot:CAMPEP_0171105072 /NCGR_PEP_ID=MMETSP0766_2-20121228/61912_1 /TAXON_ID=439317 /ORGANISM="Gambierdiscus australes, Strain CAWD 149" /LENGTH=333 /DNA_ID=CAMNT_0011565821 /DNA_START=19 /DNA_END=1020 /DNA_ORIENTATION=-